MKLDVFGKRIEVTRQEDEWIIFILGNDGKKRKATDIYIPRELSEDEVIRYIADVFHESATPDNPDIRII